MNRAVIARLALRLSRAQFAYCAIIDTPHPNTKAINEQCAV
jgi:hypothetical protein